MLGRLIGPFLWAKQEMATPLYDAILISCEEFDRGFVEPSVLFLNSKIIVDLVIIPDLVFIASLQSNVVLRYYVRRHHSLETSCWHCLR